MKIQKIYFDLDGTLADFNRGLTELCGLAPVDQANKTDEADNRMWEAIRNTDHFYDRLEPMPGAVEMVRELCARYDAEILSAVPKPKRGILTAGEDKTVWVHRLLSEDMKVNIVTREEKKNYVTGLGCILVDDLEENIKAWNECGGTGILFTSAEDTLRKIRWIESGSDIVEIRITDEPSDFCGPLEYKDTITLTANSISYNLETEPGTDYPSPKKWSYRTSNPEFTELFSAAAKQVMEYLTEFDIRCFDTGCINFHLIYRDGSEADQLFWAAEDMFDELFQIIRLMVPPLEKYPKMMRYLWLEDDEDADDDEDEDEEIDDEEETGD